MPLCDEMCNKCGTTDGVCMVTKLCDKCKENDEELKPCPFCGSRFLWDSDEEYIEYPFNDKLHLVHIEYPFNDEFNLVHYDGGFTLVAKMNTRVTSQKQPETTDKEVCVSDGGSKALDALDRISPLIHADPHDNVKRKTVSDDLIIIRQYLQQAEREQEPVDVEDIKRECLDDICKGRNITEKNVVYDIISEAVNLMNAQGYFTQSAEKDAAIRDLVGIVKRQQRQLKNSGFTATLLQQDTTATLKTHATAIERNK